MRTEQEIFDELAALCVSPGYVHALASLCFRDTVVGFADELKPEDLAKLHAPSHLIRTELTTLSGLMIRAPIDFTLPPQGSIDAYIARSDRLLDELHEAMMAGGRKVMMDNIADPNFNPFTVAEVLREAIFYSAESAYTFQYRDFAPIKYAADADWLRANRGFEMQSAREVVKAMLDLLNTRSFAALEALRTAPPDQRTMLQGFTFTGAELAAATELDPALVTRILSAFTAPVEGSNQAFKSLRAFNAAYAFPLIRKDADEYILFQYYGITEALYDAPFYWMGADKTYSATAFQNRGQFTEDFAFDRLVKVFGPGRVFKNVEIFRGKDIAGEIDVLVLFGDQAVVLQAKSKKLTLEARNGNDLLLQGDFKAAIQDAVGQAYDCAQLLGDLSVVLRTRGGEIVNVPSTPRTVYPVAVVADHYPALAFQARQLLKFTATDQIVAPLAIDVFAVDAITEMLSSPLRLLSYLRLRARFGDAFLTSHEHTLLSYHLKRNLWQGDFDMMLVHDDISSDLDVAMAARRDDIPGAKTPSGILTDFVGTPFDKLIKQIEDLADPVSIALGFLLVELSGQTIKTLNRTVDRVLELVAKDGGTHDVTIGIGTASAGLTIHGNSLPAEAAENRLYDHVRLRKYSQKAESWYGVALRPDGSINVAAVLTGPWKFDPALELLLAKMPASKGRAASRAPRKKVGRNDPCPCGSGRKYKKCHGG